MLHIVFLLGALSIACIPFVGSGYHSKSLIHESILEYIAYLNGMGVSTANYQFVEGLFVFSGGLTGGLHAQAVHLPVLGEEP